MSIVLVTGGAGFIGSHLVDRLLERGAAVRVLDNLSSGSLRNLQAAADGPAGPAASGSGRRLELMVGDVRDERLVRKAMQHVDRVFHVAALSPRAGALARPNEMHAVNAQGTLNVLQAAAAEGARRVVFGSCASVYGAGDREPSSESSPPQPASIFAASKLAGEIYCQAYQNTGQVETVALRYFTVYGPRQTAALDGALVPLLVEQLRRRRRPAISGDGRASQDFMFVDDAVEATLAAMEAKAAAGRVINVASGQLASPIEVLDIVNRLLRTDMVPRLVPRRGAVAACPRPGIGLAREILGSTPRVSLVAGVARVVESLGEADDEGLLAEVAPREERSQL